MALTLADFLADVAAVYTGSATEGSFGSGRLIAPGLVLTAGHVVDYPSRAAPSRTGWKVRLLRERAPDGTWTAAPHEGELLWRGSGELDLALLRIHDDVAPLLKPAIASYDELGTIDAVDAAGFPEAWYDTAGTLRDYRVRGTLRLAAQAGPYAWSVPPADKPDDPKGWRGMSGAAVCYVGREDKLYLFGAVQQVPANFSGGLLEVARISSGMADAGFSSFVGAALREQPPVVRWAADSSYGFSKPELNELLEKLRGSEAIPASWVERQEKLAARAAVSEQALTTIARRLGVENIPAGELGPALIDRIDRLHLAENQVQALPGDSPMKPLAAAATGRGEYDRAERLLAAAQQQIRAIQFLNEGAPDQAIATLQEAVRQLGEVPAESPIDDRIAQGYLYKALEQAFSAKGDQTQADQYLTKALTVFQGLARETLPEGDTVRQFAEIMNGMGNLRAARGQHKEAIREYQLATALFPGYAYSWNDMFLSYHALAEQGEVHLPEMRQALANARQMGKGWQGFEGGYFDRLDSMLAQFDKPKKGTSRKKR